MEENDLIEGGTAVSQIIEAARARAGVEVVDVAEGLDASDAFGPVPMMATPCEGGATQMESVLAEVKAWREFRRLAAANQLTRAEARLLWRFGCAADPAQPQLAFVRPTLLDSPDRGATPELVQSIREKLFGV